jgi:carboxypeptidase Taq
MPAMTSPDTKRPETPHARLCAYLREKEILGSIASNIGWDEQTQLPKGGTDLRADQSSLLARMSHEQGTDPRLGELISAAEEAAKGLAADSDEATTAREARRDYDRATKLPADLVEEMARAQVQGHAAWVEARKTNDFKMFQPHLATTIRLKQREAQCIGYKTNPYDALLDDYEPGETAAGVEKAFNGFKAELIDLVGRIRESGRKPRTDLLERSFPVEQQKAMSRMAAEAVGFDFESGRLDIAVHPFCSGLGPGDTRMTTRYDEHDVGNSFFSTLHETGHGLYEQGLRKREYFGTGCAESVSLGIHESQSRMWENLVGRSRAFWQFFWPKMQGMFKQSLGDVKMEDWLGAVNAIRPTFIRTESDEATYNLHILMRFELEQAMLRDELPLGDVPGAWDEKMRGYLGVTPPEPSKGVLQDVHWSSGYVGYFPTYTLGNLYAAQFFEAARKDLGDLDGMFARGEFAPLLNWLREKIHHQGRRYTARQLAQRITGKDLSHEALMSHLKRKAAEYYGV